MEINGLEASIKAIHEKDVKRTEQIHSSELAVKKQKDEIKRISKEIKPKSVKSLLSIIEKKNPEKIR